MDAIAAPVTVDYYRYSGFFHYRYPASVEPLVEWLKSFSVEVAWSLEKVHAENPTDKHIQWQVVCDAPWDAKRSNALSLKGAMGKHLVEKKVANNGEKDAKRWSKIDCKVKGYTRVSGLDYVYKDSDAPGSVYGYWHRDGKELDFAVHFGVHHAAKAAKAPRRAKARMPFWDEMLALWDEKGRPSEVRDIFLMLCRHVDRVRWNYVDGRSLHRVARKLYALANPEEFVWGMMTRFDNGEYNI